MASIYNVQNVVLVNLQECGASFVSLQKWTLEQPTLDFLPFTIPTRPSSEILRHGRHERHCTWCRLLTSANYELQSPSRGTDRQTADLEIAHLLRNPKFQCHALKGQPLTAFKSNCNKSTPIQLNYLSKQQNYLYELRQWVIRSWRFEGNWSPELQGSKFPKVYHVDSTSRELSNHWCSEKKGILRHTTAITPKFA